MGVNIEAYQTIISELNQKNTQLIAVSKTKPIEDIEALYNLGQKDFGENYVQELVDKQAILPKDIRWHFIGHLQSNKVKYIAPFVHLIHGVDSLKLLQEINKQGIKNNRTISCLLQMHIAKEETKFGLDENELEQVIAQVENLPNVQVSGLMGMASFTNDTSIVQNEFKHLHALFLKYQSLNEQTPNWNILSMGMSGDYPLAIDCGSNMVRIGSLLFGARNYTT
ncbi:MAG: YggS family pyridoxal phosphate-dependent enzyme [Sediminibacterium sp.]|nr:YggS family pyridoxal phosphate-dependent enzyme [Sediminibacterium sp.]